MSPQGHLRVTMPVSFGRRHVMQHLPRLLERYPDITIDAVITDEVVNLIDSGIDLAIRVGSLTDSQLMARKLTEHRRIVRSEEHTSELPSLLRHSYAVFCLQITTTNQLN